MAEAEAVAVTLPDVTATSPKLARWDAPDDAATTGEAAWWVVFNALFGCLAARGPKAIDARHVFTGHRDPLTESRARAVADAWMAGETGDALRLLEGARPVPSLTQQVEALAD